MTRERAYHILALYCTDDEPPDNDGAAFRAALAIIKKYGGKSSVFAAAGVQAFMTAKKLAKRTGAKKAVENWSRLGVDRALSELVTKICTEDELLVFVSDDSRLEWLLTAADIRMGDSFGKHLSPYSLELVATRRGLRKLTYTLRRRL